MGSIVRHGTIKVTILLDFLKTPVLGKTAHLLWFLLSMMITKVFTESTIEG